MCVTQIVGCLGTANKVISGYINIVAGSHVVCAGGVGGGGMGLIFVTCQKHIKMFGL